MTIHKKIIYLPIETKSREFDSKCLIALSCLQHDVAVVIGKKGELKTNQPGVILLKSAAGYELSDINALHDKGVKTCVIDEEGFVQTANEKQRALRYSQQTLDAVDQILFNGQAEQNLMNKMYSVPKNKGVITGNPRFDFYKKNIREYYRALANKYQSKHGDYILIASRFGNITPNRKVDYLHFLKHVRKIDSETDLDIFRSFFAHSKKIYDEFLALLPSLSTSFPENTIVIRPHPSESLEPWLKASVGLSNVKVIRDGPIGPWVLGAKAVLHNGCTTGLEAFLMDRPVFSYMPFTSDEYDLKLPNNVSIQCYSKQELLSTMHKSLEQENVNTEDRKQKISFVKGYLNNADEQNAFESIANELVKLSDSVAEVNVKFLSQTIQQKIRTTKIKLLSWYCVVLSRFKIPLPHKWVDTYYMYKKNPGFTFDELSNNLNVLSKLTGLSKNGLVIKKLQNDLFLITKSK